jgi:hypothetical protein
VLFIQSYPIVDAMAQDLGCSVTDLMRDEGLRRKINLSNYVTEQVGLPTLNDILAELSKPGRDPREQFEAFQFADGIKEIQDVRLGMKLPGIVTNITAFGVFRGHRGSPGRLDSHQRTVQPFCEKIQERSSRFIRKSWSPCSMWIW